VELIVINLFFFNHIQKNKLFFLLLLGLVSLSSIWIPGLVEEHENHNQESFFKYIKNDTKTIINLRKLLRLVFIKIFYLMQILTNLVVLLNIRLVLFNIRFSEVANQKLFSILCFYFNGNKFKHIIHYN
jgi:hypothetical protein